MNIINRSIKHIAIAIPLISSVLLSCVLDIEMGCLEPEGNKAVSIPYSNPNSLSNPLLPSDTQSKPDHEIEMGKMPLKPKRSTNSNSSTSIQISPINTLRSQQLHPSTSPSPMLTGPKNELIIDLEKLITLGSFYELLRIMSSFYGPVIDGFFVCSYTNRLQLLSKGLYHKLSSSPLSVESLTRKYLIIPQIRVYEKLNIQIPEKDVLPIPSQVILEMYRLQKSGKDPLLIYDTGLSIGALKERYNLLMNISEQLTARYHIHHNSGEMPIHREIMDVTGHPQWILLPGVVGGILPGSKSKKFDQKILYMFIHYMGYRAGNAREMATVAMMGTLCGRHMFPCHTDEQTCGICITKVERRRSSIRNQRLIIAGDRERANVFACYFGPTNFRVAQEGLFGIYDYKQGDVRASIYNFTLIKYLCRYIKLIIFWIGEWWEEFVELWQ